MEAQEMIDLIIKSEGGYVNNPKDKGGATKYGITQATLNLITDSKKMNRMKVRDLSLAMAQNIYKEKYLEMCTTCNKAVTLLVFDWGVNSGTGTAIIGLQKILGVKQDGIIGAITNKSIKDYCSPDMLVARIIDARHAFYANIVGRNPSQICFLIGWSRRVSNLLREIEEKKLSTEWVINK
jgi:lysozyme family protein